MRIQLLLLCTLAARCGATPTEVQLGREFDLAIGQTVRLGGSGTTITFASVPEDSRCPSDVVCVWAGNARVSLRLHVGTQEVSAAVNTTLEPRAATLNGLHIELRSLAPVPRTGAPKADYRARLLVTGT